MALSGKSGSVIIGTNRVAEISNWSIDAKADNIEVTNYDSDGWKEYIAGLKEWSGKFEGNLNPGDANGQVAIINAWLNGEVVSLKLNIDDTKNLSGDAYINFSIEMPIDDKGNFSCDFTGTGPLTPTLT